MHIENDPIFKSSASKSDKLPIIKRTSKGEVWVIQLGALKNADKVSEIVNKLRFSGYRVYTSPSSPVQGRVTRIFVGPDASKHKLSSFNGQLRSYHHTIAII